MKNYILTLCYQGDTDADAIAKAAVVAEASGEWVQVDFRDSAKTRRATIGPKGEFLAFWKNETELKEVKP